jgi:hypothetical protein
MASFAAPSSDLPSWLQQGNTAQLQQVLSSLPALFNTKGLTNRYNGAISSELAQGQALASAGARQYANRAAQVGASGLGAGFAQGQAMLPYFNQRNDMLTDLEKQKALARSQQGQLASDLAGRIGQLQQMRQATISDYSSGQQKLQQEASQFDTSQSEREREFNTTAGMQQQSQNLDAMKLAMSLPRQRYEWNTGMNGQPLTANDRQQQQGFSQQQNYFGQLRSALGRTAGVGTFF